MQLLNNIHWSKTFSVGGGLFSSRTFLVRVGFFCVRGGLFFIGGGLFPSPTVAGEKIQLQRKKVKLQSQKGVGLWNIPVNLSSQVHLWSSGQ